jgi:beta-lactamase regulating signal transducer with metallopeptidase domain
MENYLSQIINYLLTQSWQITLLVIVIAAVTLALKNRSAHVRYLLWLIVLAKCLVPPLVNIPLAVLPQDKMPEPTLISNGEIPAANVEMADTVASKPVVLPSSPFKSPTILERLEKVTVRQWLGFGWIVGVAAFLFFAVIKALRTQLWLKCERKSLPAELQMGIKNLFSGLNLKTVPKIWLVEGIGQPFVWGLFRGSIYLPADFVKIDNAEQQRGVLGHELSHVLRYDALVNLLQIIVQAIFWFHLFVWWANKKIRAEREKCCDEMAIARLGAKAKDYSAAIVNILISEYESIRPVPSLAVAGPVKNIEERIKTMLRPGKIFYKRPSLIAVTIALLLAVLIVPTAILLTAQAEEKSSMQKEDSAKASVKAPEDQKLERVKKFIAQVADINRGDTWGYTWLHHACMNGEKQVAEFLIAKGADVDAKSVSGITSLHAAAGRGHRDIAKLLIEKKADVNAEDSHGATPIWYAKNGVVYSFSTHGWFNKSLWNAQNPGCKEIVELLRKKGAEERTPVLSLHEAAAIGDIDQVKFLISKGVDVNVMDNRLNGTPLHLAVHRNQMQVINLLIANGANVNAKNKLGRSSLHTAIDKGRTEIAELLRKHGARIESDVRTAKIKNAKSLFESATSKCVIPKKNLEIPKSVQLCVANLQKIHAAIKKYEKDKGTLPIWLSDLVPDYLSEENLLCPNNPKAQVKWPKDPELPCGYTYQFSPARQWSKYGGSPVDGMTMRDRKVAQMKLFGDVVPLCSCRHDPRMNLNVSFNGKVYSSGVAWEYTIMPDYKVGSELSEELLR